MEIQFKKGSRVSVKLETLCEEIEKASDEDGLSIPTLVKNARPKAAPLHDQFEWDNKTAGANWRLFQGRRLVGKIEVVATDRTPAVRAFHSVVMQPSNPDEKPERRFRKVQDIMSAPSERADLLRQAINDAVTFRNKYAALQEFAQVFAEIDAAAQKAVA